MVFAGDICTYDVTSIPVCSGGTAAHVQTHALLFVMQGLAKSPELVKALLSSTLLPHVAKLLTSASDKLAREVAVLVQYMALNSSPDQLPSADLKAVMHSLAQQSLQSADQLLQAAVGSAACSLPVSLFMPDVRPPLPSPPQTPPPPPLPVSKFIWDAMDYDAPASAAVSAVS